MPGGVEKVEKVAVRTSKKLSKGGGDKPKKKKWGE